MSCVYVTEQGSNITVGEGKLVIECKNNQYIKMLSDIEKMLEPEDNVRIYRMTGYEEIHTFGSKEYETFEDVVII